LRGQRDDSAQTEILRYLDLVDPLARRIGAVNTVWRKAGNGAARIPMRTG